MTPRPQPSRVIRVVAVGTEEEEERAWRALRLLLTRVLRESTGAAATGDADTRDEPR